MQRGEQRLNPVNVTNLSREKLRPLTPDSSGYYKNPDEQHRQELDRFRREYRAFSEEINGSDAPRETLGNQELPIAAYKEQIVQAIEENQLIIIQAETGSGKSTQVPQFALEAGYDVVQTQPRRVAAREVTDRIGKEIMAKWGDVSSEISAYHTAEKNTTTERTRIKNVTDGLLLAQDGGVKGREVSRPEVVVIDEVHEWNMNIEMELAFVLRQLQEYPDRRFVIQSATLDAKELQAYFAQALDGELPPIIEVEGRTYPVEMHEHPDEELVSFAVERAKQRFEQIQGQKDVPLDERQPTAIMITAPGKREIADWIDEITAALPQEISQTAAVLPLHSRLNDAEQNMALRTDYEGLKIIVATNAAKTSLTIPDIAEVIDSGYARHVELDSDGFERLMLIPTSKADRMQWAGRAGRVAPGEYHLVNMPDMPFVPMEKCLPYEVPEAQRTDPVRHVLRSAAMGVDFAELKLVHPIKGEVIDHAKETLRLLGALDEQNQVTSIGKRMNEFPLSPASARMVVQADQYSPQVRSYIAAIAGAQEAGGLPSFMQDNGRRWKTLLENEDSDLLAQLDIFIKMQNINSSAKMKEYDLDEKNLRKARETYWKVVRLSDGYRGELESPSLEEIEQLKRCIYSGMPDGLYKYAGDLKYVGIDTRESRLREASNRSVLRTKSDHVVATPREIEKYVKGVRVPKDIIENITRADPKVFVEQLSVTALSRVTKRPIGEVRWLSGRPHVETESYLGNVATGITELTPAQPGRETQDFIIAHALENPGVAQRHIRSIKKHLEELQHLTPHPIPQLSQSQFEQMLRDATPIGQHDLAMTDVNLSLRQVTLRDYISEEQEYEIRAAAPASIETSVGTIALQYRNGRPVAKSANLEALLAGSLEDIALPDGRLVYFVVKDEGHDGRRREYILSQIRNQFH